MDDRRVVITGMGTVNPLANNTSDTWDAVLKGKSGIAKITHFDPSTHTSKIAGEVKNFNLADHFDEASLKTAKRLDPFVHYAKAAVKEALVQSGLEIEKDPYSVGICFGAGMGGIKTQHSNSEALVTRGHRRVSPYYVPGAIGNIAAGLISMEFGIKGPNLATQTACATANHAIGVALLLIKAGMAKAVIAGGAESAVEELTVSGFENMHALSTHFNDSPELASRPFDTGRDGFVIAEGAGALVIEDYESAKNRGAEIICEVLSVGMSGDAYDLVMPDPEGRGALYSMQMAVKNAGISLQDIVYINTHGTSTPLGDRAETKAVYDLLKGRQDNVYVGSTKSMHGHLLGATSALEAVICAKSVQDNLIPANINLFQKDKDILLDCFPVKVIETEVKVALSNSFGFGGHNSSLILRKI